MMTLEQARNNIDGLIANSRLTRQEHVVLQQSLEMLYSAAKENQESKEENKDAGN